MNKKHVLLITLYLLAEMISAQGNIVQYMSKNHITKNINRVILNKEKELPYFFEYDSIITLKGVNQTEIQQINTYLRSNFVSFIHKNHNKSQVIYGAKQDFIEHTNGVKRFIHSSTYITDYTSTYLNIISLKSWCCSQNGLLGYESQPTYTIDIKTLKPIKLDAIFLDGFKDALIEVIRNHPNLKDLEEDEKVIQQSICEDDKKKYLIQKVKNAITTKDIRLKTNRISLNTDEIIHCSEIEKYDPDYNPIEIEVLFSDLREFIKPNNPYILKF